MEKIVENNILLAEFLDMLTTDSEGNIKEDSNSLKFHNDWNWLMLVVDKIESITVDRDNYFNVTIGASNYCVIQDSNGVLYDGVEDGGESKLLTVYFACVRFVKWFNENK